ncbi:redoxin domain-containing protein, partial [Litorivivens sp.]
AKRDCVVLGVSFDPVAKLKKFQEKYDLNFTLLSDEDHAVIDKYGCWQLKKFMGKENMGTVRTTFIIGKDGRLKYILDKFKTKTHHEDLVAWVEQNL